MTEKPKEPQKQHIESSRFITAAIVFLLASFLFVTIWGNHNKNKIYKIRLAEYKEIEEQQKVEIANAKEQVFEYIHSIDNHYDIDAAGSIPVSVSIKKVRDKDAQSIGNELSYHYSINGTDIHNKAEIRINLFQEIEFNTEIIENDPASDDIGREKTTQAFSFAELNNGIQIQQTIRVREKYGHDAGNTDIYHVTYTIKPRQTLNLSAQQTELFPQYPIMPREPKKADYSMGVWETIRHFSDVRIGIVIIFSVVVLFLIGYICRTQRKNKAALCAYHKALEEYNTERMNFIQSMDGKPIRELAHVPDDVLFTNGDLPYNNASDDKFGSFTLYVPYSGNCYHTRKDCSNARLVTPVHIYNLSPHYIPCRKCAQNVDIRKPEWYIQYLKYKRDCEHYDIKLD